MWHGTVSEFQGRTSTTAQTKKLADELDHSAKESGQSTSESETKSWINSLPALATTLTNVAKGDHYIVLECPMPGANCRADAVLLGEQPNGARRVAVIELKQWQSVEPGGADLVSLGGRPRLHPSAQVQGYRDYLVDRFCDVPASV